MDTEHIFVLGLDDFNRAMLERLRGAEHMAFHGLLSVETAVDVVHYDVADLLDQARQTLRAFPHPIHALVGYWDFPTSTMLPVLRRAFGLRGPSLESTLRCEHKYWSRLQERQAAPRETPRFAVVDPFAEDVLDRPPLPYPFWIKPVRSHSSQLGFRIDDDTDFAHAIDTIRQKIAFLAEPFTYLMGLADLPPDIAAVDGWHCVAEEIIASPHQCTLEGYVLNGEVTIYGTVDSLREGRHASSFSRYQYPSQLPGEVQQIMEADVRRFLRRVGYDNAPFNVEFFYAPDTGALRMVEVNTRCSKSHSPLFEMVDGTSNLQVMVDVALGREPDFPPEGGRFAHAAKFMLRRDQDARVLRVPTEAEIRAIERDMPGVAIQVEAKPGRTLSALLHQDSYTFEYATVFIGGNDIADIEARYRHVGQRLDFRFEERSDVDMREHRPEPLPGEEDRSWPDHGPYP